MFLLYDIIFLIFMIGYLPVFFVKIQQADDKRKLVRDRFAFYTKEFRAKVADKKVIWIHAVSVGETLAMQTFFDHMRAKFPTYTYVISTVTPTGNRIARSIAQGKAEVIYFPIDVSWITRRAVKIINPKLIILMETELWPNLILSAKKAGSRIAIINGRLSPRSFRNYYKIQGLLHGVLRKIDLYLTQTERYAKRMMRIGVPKSHVAVTGNMKFDSVTTEGSIEEAVELLMRTYSLDRNNRYFLGASTHPSEEAFLLSVFRELRTTIPDLKLILVPRHIERVNDIVKEVADASCSYRVAVPDVLDSEYATKQSDDADVFVMNTIGELKTISACATIVFIGGSIIKHGGQNPLEAIALKKPVITGPYVFNFPGMYDVLCPMGAVKQVSTVSECTAVCQELLTQPVLGEKMSHMAFEWLQDKKGASERNVARLEELLMEV